MSVLVVDRTSHRRNAGIHTKTDGIPEKIRQRQRAELAAIHRLEAAGYTVEGWNHTTSLCTVARLDGLNTNHDKSKFLSFPTWQAAASALLG